VRVNIKVTNTDKLRTTRTQYTNKQSFILTTYKAMKLLLNGSKSNVVNIPKMPRKCTKIPQMYMYTTA